MNLDNFFFPANHPASSHDDRIELGKTYLVRVYGKWYLGTFSQQWYGWSFNNWGASGIQLNSTGVEAVCEADISELEELYHGEQISDSDASSSPWA